MTENIAFSIALSLLDHQKWTINVKFVVAIATIKFVVTHHLSAKLLAMSLFRIVFTIERKPSGISHISFEGIEMKYFNIIVATQMPGYYQLVLRFFIGVNKILCSKFDQMLALGTGKLPQQFKKNTALVVCLSSQQFDINVKLLGNDYGSVHWSSGSFTVSEALDINNVTDALEIVDPNFIQRCPECLVISPTGSGHVSPCPPCNTISPLRSSISSTTMTPVIKIRFENPLCSVQVLNKEINRFVDVHPNLKMLNEVIEGIFHFNTIGRGRKVMTFEAASMKRFSIIFAFLHKHSRKLRLRMVISLKNGVVAFPLTKTLFLDKGNIDVPKEYNANTALFIGLHTQSDDIQFTVRAYANAAGRNIISNGKFNGLEAHVHWDRTKDAIQSSKTLDSRFATKRLFDDRLYRANGVHRVIGSIARQRFVAPPAIPDDNTFSSRDD